MEKVMERYKSYGYVEDTDMEVFFDTFANGKCRTVRIDVLKQSPYMMLAKMQYDKVMLRNDDDRIGLYFVEEIDSIEACCQTIIMNLIASKVNFCMFKDWGEHRQFFFMVDDISYIVLVY